MSLKFVEQLAFELFYRSLVNDIWQEYDRHRYVLEDNSVTEEIKERYNPVLKGTTDKPAYTKIIAFLSECLEKYHVQKTIYHLRTLTLMVFIIKCLLLPFDFLSLSMRPFSFFCMIIY